MAGLINGIDGQGKFTSTQRLDQAGTIIGSDGKLSNAVTDGEGLVVGKLTSQAERLGKLLSFQKVTRYC